MRFGLWFPFVVVACFLGIVKRITTGCLVISTCYRFLLHTSENRLGALIVKFSQILALLLRFFLSYLMWAKYHFSVFFNTLCMCSAYLILYTTRL